MSAAYYNEFDPGTAAWLRELIKRNLIADGEVDERSILDVRPVDLRGFTQCHFFAGIGGWSYALRLAGWPDDRPAWTGSPPCQPFSAAGAGLGRDDARHLGPHFVSLVSACRPTVLFGEQVSSSAVFGKAASGSRKAAARAPEWAWLDDLQDRLEAARYAVGASDIPAASVGAPHIRQRTFFGAIRLADADDAGSQGRIGVHERSDECTVGPRGLEGWPEHASGDGRLERRAEPSGRCAVSGCGGERLENADSERRDGERVCVFKGEPRQARAEIAGGSQDDRTNPPHSPWANPDWLFCRDGKWRPVESSVLGVPHGVPAELVRSGSFVSASTPLAQSSKDARRVMRLRGYGNAIVPQAAAEFIAAFECAASACADQWGGHAQQQEARHG